MGKRKFNSELGRHQAIKYRRNEENFVFEVNENSAREGETDQLISNNEAVSIPTSPPHDFHFDIDLNSSRSNIFQSNPLNPVPNQLPHDENCIPGTPLFSQNEHEINDENTKNELRWWFVRNKLTHKSLNELLGILNKSGKFNSIPKSSKTFMKTPRKSNVEKCGEGTYTYIPLKKVLDATLSRYHPSQIPNSLKIDNGIDGVAVFKKGEEVGATWPLLGRISNLPGRPILLFGYYCGKKKPQEPIFLKRFVEEFNELFFNYEFNGERVHLVWNFTIMDLQAVTYIHGIPGPTAKVACLYCNAKAKTRRVNGKLKVIHPLKIGRRLRTDDDFRSKRFPNFHRYESPLVHHFGVKFVSKTLIDVMHCVYIGNVNRLVTKWFNGLGKYGKPIYSARVKAAISNEILRIHQYICSEFNRKPGRLELLGTYKATEWRTILLFIGVICFKGFIPSQHYNHFMKLHVAMTILTDEELYREMNEVARELLEEYVKDADRIYPDGTLSTHNLHLLLHLAQQSFLNGPVETFSSFDFESFMCPFKRNFHSGHKAAAQGYKREMERLDLALNSVDPTEKKTSVSYKFIGKAVDGKFFKLIAGDCLLSTKQKDKFVLTSRGEICSINFFKTNGTEITANVKKFVDIEDLYEKPIVSSALNIVQVHRNDVHAFDVDIDIKDIKRKCLAIPVNDKIAVFPLSPIKFSNVPCNDD